MRHINYIKSISLIIVIFLFTSCSKNTMKPEDFKNKEPRLIIEEYLSGNVKAWGVLQNRSGKVTRQFSANLDGSWDGKQLILREKFNWDDGEVQNREWTIKKIDDNKMYGVSLRFANDDTDIGNAGTNISTQSINLSVYGSRYLDNNTYMDGVVGAGYMQSDLVR